MRPPRRGRETLDAAGILFAYRGRAVHDFWRSYFDYDGDHALGNGHLLRGLIFLWEEQSQKWAKAMNDHLLAIMDAVATAGAAGLTALSPADQERFLKDHGWIVQAGDAQNPAAAAHGPKRRGRRQQSKARNLLDRCRDHPDSVPAVMRDFAVPFDNNQSERDLRMRKLRQKIPGTFRSFEALVNFCRLSVRVCTQTGIRSYVSTALPVPGTGDRPPKRPQRVGCGTACVPRHPRHACGRHLVSLAHASGAGARSFTLRWPPQDGRLTEPLQLETRERPGRGRRVPQGSPAT